MTTKQLQYIANEVQAYCESCVNCSYCVFGGNKRSDGMDCVFKNNKYIHTAAVSFKPFEAVTTEL